VRAAGLHVFGVVLLKRVWSPGHLFWSCFLGLSRTGRQKD